MQLFLGVLEARTEFTECKAVFLEQICLYVINNYFRYLLWTLRLCVYLNKILCHSWQIEL